MMRINKFGVILALSLFSLVWAMCPVFSAEWRSQRTIQLTPELLKDHPDDKIPVVVGISLNQTGDRLVTVGDDHIARVWELPSGKIIHRLTDQADWVRDAKFSPDGQYMVTGGMDQEMFCYDGKTFLKKFDFNTGGNSIRSIAFSRDNERMAMVGFDSKLRFYRLSHKREPITLDANGSDQRCVAFSADGRYLAAAGRTGQVRIFDMSKPDTYFDLPKLHTRRINTLAFIPDEKSYKLATGGDDQKIYIWSVEERKALESFSYPSGKVSAVTFCGTDMIAAGSTNNSLSVWQLGSGSRQPVYYSQEHTGTIAELVWDEANRRLISCSFDTTVKFWRVDTAVASGGPEGSILRR